MGLANCTLDLCMLSTSPYGLKPSLAASAIFLTISSICLVGNIAVTVKSQRSVAFGIFFSIACLLEIFGWADRIAGWRNPWDLYPYMQSTVVLTIAPIFITSSIYVCLGEVVRTLGAEHSLINPNLYALIFLPLDGVSLLLQIAGFAIAFSDAGVDSGLGENARIGSKVVLAGLAIQFTTLVVATTFLAIILLRAARANSQYGYTTFHKDVGYVPLTKKFQIFAAVLPTVCICICGRLLYRISWFSEGLSGPLAINEGLFIGLEGFLLSYALLALVGCHPGVFLKGGERSSAMDTVPFVEGHERNLEEVSKVYEDHHRKVSRNLRSARSSTATNV